MTLNTALAPASPRVQQSGVRVGVRRFFFERQVEEIAMVTRGFLEREIEVSIATCGQLLELLEAVAEALDVGRAAGLLVGLDDDGVQARIAGRGFEPRGHAGQEPAERRPRSRRR